MLIMMRSEKPEMKVKSESRSENQDQGMPRVLLEMKAGIEARNRNQKISKEAH